MSTAEALTFRSGPELAKAGYPVFPVSRGGKNPSVEGGFYAATTNLSEIAAWIEEGRGHDNVAVPTGLPSGVVVIEADTPETYAEMEARYGPPTVKTRRGGHWWFRHPRNGRVVSNSVKPGLDRKGDGGYVLVPPSLGRAWTNGMPRLEDLTALPEEFWTKQARTSEAPRSMPPARKADAAGVIARAVAEIPPGKRHEHLRHLLGVLLAREVPLGDAEDIATDAWQRVGGDLAERAGKEIPNTIRTTVQALAVGRATGVPKLEEITPGLYEELAGILGWVVRVTFGGKTEEQAGEGASEGREDRRNQGDRLIGYALEELGDGAFFADQHGEPHALIAGSPVPLNTRCYPWLRRLMWEREGRAVNGEYLKTAAGTLAAHAEFSGEVHELHTRAAWYEGALYYELRPGKVVRVGEGGWTYDANSPVLFRRYPNLKPLPDPEAGGSLDGLLSLVNLKTERDRRLFAAYAVTVALPHVGRPIFSANGPMGSGKTTAGRAVKRLWDPTAPETVRYDPRDFLQKASHCYIPMLDNLSTLPDAAADTLCRLVTGEADSKRKLYTDDEDVIIELRRAVILNGINAPTDRGDVLDRSLVVELERIPDRERRTEEEIWAAFEEEHPRLLGAALDALSRAIARKASLQLPRRPRLADWGEYAAAFYEVMGWGAELFLSDWDEVVKVQNRATLDGSPLAQAVMRFMEDRDFYEGTSTEAHKKLESVAEDIGVSVSRDRAWPKSARWLWRRMQEVVPLLVAVGIEAARRETERGSVIALRKTPTDDASNASRDGQSPRRPGATGDTPPHDATPNASRTHDAGSNARHEPVGGAEDGDTGNSGIISAPTSEDVRALFRRPPEWLRRQEEKCREEGAPARLVKALAAAVAAHLAGDATRGGEVLPAVGARFHPLGCGCGECA